MFPPPKKIPTKAALLIVVRAALWSPGQFTKCPACVCRRSGMVPMLESSWEQIRQWPAVPYLHWRRRSYRLAQSGSSQAKWNALSLCVSLTDATRALVHLFYNICFIQFVCFNNFTTNTAPMSKLIGTSAEEEMKIAPVGGS